LGSNNQPGRVKASPVKVASIGDTPAGLFALRSSALSFSGSTSNSLFDFVAPIRSFTSDANFGAS